MRDETKRAILNRIANQAIGDVFHIGRIAIERIGEFDVMIGNGYQDMPVSEFIMSIQRDTFFAGYPVYPNDYYTAKWEHSFTMPDLQWAYS